MSVNLWVCDRRVMPDGAGWGTGSVGCWKLGAEAF